MTVSTESSVRLRKLKESEDEIPEIITLDGSEPQMLPPTRRWWHSYKLILQVLLLAMVSAVILVLLLTTSPIEPAFISLSPPPKFVGVLEPNTRLRHATHMFSGELLGPESMTFDPTGQYLYTGTADGRIMEIFGGKTRELVRLGEPPCGSFDDEPTCGRPLGMKFDTEGFLIVVDAYLGIFQVNVVTGDVSQLLPATEIGSVFLNDLDIARNGMIYFTDSSNQWSRRFNRLCVMEGKPTGRLFEFNPLTKEVKTVIKDLSFANGVTLSYKEDYILVTETGAAKITRLWLRGEKEGQVETFAENLPGLPDNIRRTGRGTYWVAMATTRRSGVFNFFDFGASRPWLRKLVTKFFSQEFIMNLIPKYGLIIELNKDGEIVQSLHDPTGEVVPSVSEVEERDGVLYLGSYHSPYLSIMNLKQENRHT